MKKITIILILAAMCSWMNAQVVIPHRGEIMQVYGGDTLRIQFTDDGVEFVTNLSTVIINGNSVPVGALEDDTITIATTQDTVSFPALDDDWSYLQSFTVKYDTINAADCTVNFQQTCHADSTYLGVNDSVFPYTLPWEGDSETNFINVTGLKYQRAIIDWGSVTAGTIRIIRKIKIRQ